MQVLFICLGPNVGIIYRAIAPARFRVLGLGCRPHFFVCFFLFLVWRGSKKEALLKGRVPRRRMLVLGCI